MLSHHVWINSEYEYDILLCTHQIPYPRGGCGVLIDVCCEFYYRDSIFSFFSITKKIIKLFPQIQNAYEDAAPLIRNYITPSRRYDPLYTTKEVVQSSPYFGDFFDKVHQLSVNIFYWFLLQIGEAYDSGEPLINFLITPGRRYDSTFTSLDVVQSSPYFGEYFDKVHILSNTVCCPWLSNHFIGHYWVPYNGKTQCELTHVCLDPT